MQKRREQSIKTAATVFKEEKISLLTKMSEKVLDESNGFSMSEEEREKLIKTAAKGYKKAKEALFKSIFDTLLEEVGWLDEEEMKLWTSLTS